MDLPSLAAATLEMPGGNGGSLGVRNDEAATSVVTRRRLTASCRVCPPFFVKLGSLFARRCRHYAGGPRAYNGSARDDRLPLSLSSGGISPTAQGSAEGGAALK